MHSNASNASDKLKKKRPKKKEEEEEIRKEKVGTRIRSGLKPIGELKM